MDCHRSTNKHPCLACGLASPLRRRDRHGALTTYFALAFALTTHAQPTAPSPNISPTARAMRHDAALSDIYFLSDSQGWAVGDRGVIWHTDDGGKTWSQQPSPVSCHLSAVYFADSKRGWAVGGESQLGRAGSRGVVLRTDDGGAAWAQIPRLVLPRLCGVKFFDRNRGVAFGDGASFSPSGGFVTRDGGNTWQPLPADESGNWLAGDFIAPDVGAVAGPAGQLATLTRQKLVHSTLATPSLRSIRSMRLVAPTGGWAVGDGGLLLTTQDLGRSWQTPPTDLPDVIADNFDFHAVAVQGTQLWVAGSPGTQIFYSPDSGKTWESLATGQAAPIRALTFIDDRNGWAAGEFGNILATHDGGRSWQLQRTGGQRAALFAVFAGPTDVPFELLADAGAADGYITAVDILYNSATASGETASAVGQRSREAMLLAGASSAETSWRFPVPADDLALSPADLIQAINRENDGRALVQLESHLVRELRTLRPDVVVTHHGQLETSEPMAALAEQLVMRAVAAAADPAQHPELSADIGLAPWQVKKVYGVLPPGARGDEMFAAGRFSPWLGAALSDFVSPARALLLAARTTPPDTYELKLLASTVTDSANARGLFAGISLAPGSDARRPQADLPVQDLEALRRLATRRRHLQELMERSEGSAAWAGQVSNMIDGLNPEDAGQLLVQLADGYRNSGRLDLAADTYFLFARQYPDHPLTDHALLWLVQFYSSSETAQRLHRSLGEPASAGGAKRAAPLEPNPIQQASATVSIPQNAQPAGGLARDDRLRRATQLADYLKTARPALYAEPTVRFAETTAQRELGFANPAQRYFITLRDLPESDPWRQCAATEEWLAQPTEQPPLKKLATCRTFVEPPTLDGDLDELLWSKADRLRLRPEPAEGRHTDKMGERAAAPGGEVQLARDNEFLYIAVRCPKQEGVDYHTDDSPRPRDADLTAHDRVTIRLDTDRDYSTAFELSVDNRGWTRDACWDDANWNPAWYVAAAGDDTTWTIEAAIPLAELVDKPPAARAVWAVSARRTIPRVGYQTWSGNATSDESPAQFGLLIFE